MYFPPSFFDIMEHLMVHIVPEILNLGHMFLHNIYPFERYNGVLKRYVTDIDRKTASSKDTLQKSVSSSAWIT